MAHVYFHVDLNAFFINAEILLDPSIKGKPAAVSGNTRRSVVSTASYEARAYGVHSAMPIQEAIKLCPDLLVLPGHYAFYEQLSSQFMSIVRSYTDEVEQASIDECYVDMTEPISHFQHPLDLAVQLQQRILKETGLPCSIGVAPNMFLAKMASDMKKPMGITVLRIRDVEQKMWPLPIGDMRGVGKKTEPLLKELGIMTIGDLARYPNKNALVQIFGRNTDAMLARTHGYDDRTIVKAWDARSMGVSETMLEDVTDYDEIRGLFRSLSRRLSQRMKEERKLGTSVSIRIKYFDFRNADRSMKIAKPIWKSEDIFHYAMTLFDANWDSQPVRLVGISLSDLKRADEMVSQLDLFNQDAANKEATGAILYDLNKMANSPHLFVRASDLLKDKANGTH